MKLLLILLSIWATILLIVAVATPSWGVVPTWSLLLALALSSYAMVYLRICYERAMRERDEIQTTLARSLPRYVATDPHERQTKLDDESRALLKAVADRRGLVSAAMSGDESHDGKSLTEQSDSPKRKTVKSWPPRL